MILVFSVTLCLCGEVSRFAQSAMGAAPVGAEN